MLRVSNASRASSASAASKPAADMYHTKMRFGFEYEVVVGGALPIPIGKLQYLLSSQHPQVFKKRCRLLPKGDVLYDQVLTTSLRSPIKDAAVIVAVGARNKAGHAAVAIPIDPANGNVLARDPFIRHVTLTDALAAAILARPFHLTPERYDQVVDFYMQTANEDIWAGVPRGTGSWSVTRDGSVKYDQGLAMYKKKHGDLKELPKHKFYNGMEIVSPVMHGPAGVDHELQALAADLERVGAAHDVAFYNNHTTSNHVHISICNDKECKNNLLRHVPSLAKALVAWLYFEPVFLNLVAKARHDSPYCMAYNRTDDCQAIEVKCKTIECILDMPTRSVRGTENANRYVSANLQNLKKGEMGTIEIRIKQGSNDMVGENAMWVKLLGLFFSAACVAPCVEQTKQCDGAALDALFKFIKKQHKKEDYTPVLDYWASQRTK